MPTPLCRNGHDAPAGNRTSKQQGLLVLTFNHKDVLQVLKKHLIFGLTTKNTVFSDVTPCSLVGVQWRFGGRYRLRTRHAGSKLSSWWKNWTFLFVFTLLYHKLPSQNSDLWPKFQLRKKHKSAPRGTWTRNHDDEKKKSAYKTLWSTKLL